MTMIKKHWLTKDEKRLLRPHAEHFSEMFEHIQAETTEGLYMLLAASSSCATNNCWWAEYRAAQYLMDEIRTELAWRNSRDAEAAELVQPTGHILDRMADDGARIPDFQ
jgi:hypothetical protein